MRIARIVLGLGVLLIASNAFGQKVTTQSAPNVNWSQYKTYAWGESESVANPITNQYIVSAIEAQLTAKGMTKIESDPDLIVIYNASADTQKQLNWSGMGGFGRFGGGMGSAQVENITQGQLQVNIVDTKAKQFLWRGTANDTVSNDPQKTQKTITKAVTKMFQKFPPSQ
jgi:hypothetical protein